MLALPLCACNLASTAANSPRWARPLSNHLEIRLSSSVNMFHSASQDLDISSPDLGPQLLFPPSTKISSSSSTASFDIRAIPGLDEYPSLPSQSSSFGCLPSPEYDSVLAGELPPCPLVARKVAPRLSLVDADAGLLIPIRKGSERGQPGDVLVSSLTRARSSLMPESDRDLERWRVRAHL